MPREKNTHPLSYVSFVREYRYEEKVEKYDWRKNGCLAKKETRAKWWWWCMRDGWLVLVVVMRYKDVSV